MAISGESQGKRKGKDGRRRATSLAPLRPNPERRLPFETVPETSVPGHHRSSLSCVGCTVPDCRTSGLTNIYAGCAEMRGRENARGCRREYRLLQRQKRIDDSDAGNLLAGIEILAEQLRSSGLFGCGDDQRIPE